MNDKERILSNFFQIEFYPIERRINDMKGCIWFYIISTCVLIFSILLVYKTPIVIFHSIISCVFVLLFIPLLIWRLSIKQRGSFSLTFLFECVVFLLGMLQAGYLGFLFLYIDQQKFTLAHFITSVIGILMILIVLILRIRLYKNGHDDKKRKKKKVPIISTTISVVGTLFGCSLYRIVSRYFDLDRGLWGSICGFALAFIWAMFSVLQAYNFYVAHINHLDQLGDG